MTDTLVQLAKREWHQFTGHRPIWIGTLAAGVLLGLAGPFGTDEAMRLLPRTAYWVFLAGLSFLTGSICVAFATSRAARLGIGRWPALFAGACLGGALILGEVVLLNTVLFGRLPRGVPLVELALTVLAASLVITLATALISASLRQGETEGQGLPPRLLGRLPLDKRGALVSLSAVDHYVEVTTTKGTELLLMRLSDAIAEAAPAEGLQIHRSHWVALDQVTRAARDDGKTTLLLSDGRSLPVSRSNLPAVRAAGLLSG